MEPQNKVNTQTNKDKNNGTQSGRSGVPIIDVPDIRKKKSSSTNLIAGLVLLVSLGAGLYHVTDYSKNNTAITQDRTLETSHEIAKSFLAISDTESERDSNAHAIDTEGTSKAQKKVKDVTKKVVEHLEENSGTEGILSKCHIHGHDVHFIDRSGMILSHVREGEGLPDNFERAREIIMLNKDKSDLAIVVKKENLEIYNQFGELQAKECLNCQKP